MILGVGVRQTMASILLMMQTLVIALELCVFIPSIRTRRWYSNIRQWCAPIGLALLATVLVFITFDYLDAKTENTPIHCRIVDGDIAGLGVRIAAFVQVGILIFMSLLGSFHPRATGAKENGGGLLLVTFSLAIALMNPMRHGALTPADAGISAMILDGLSMALSIQLCAKETLSSRWQTTIVVLVLFVGLGALVAIMKGFLGGSYASPHCPCLKIFWWGRLSSCPSLTPQSERDVFWIYIACRFVGVLQASFHAVWNTCSFDRAEKATRDTTDELARLGGTLDNITYPHFGARGSSRYGEYPATVSLMYLLYSVLALSSLINAETTIRIFHLVPSSSFDSIGQIMALVIAVATAGRAIWLVFFLLKEHGLMWPANYSSQDASTLRSTSSSERSIVRLTRVPGGAMGDGIRALSAPTSRGLTCYYSHQVVTPDSQGRQLISARSGNRRSRTTALTSIPRAVSLVDSNEF